MAKEVTPELLKQIQDYIKERQKGETKLLSFFYSEVFGVDLKIGCGACVEDGFYHLKTVISKKTKPVMNNFIWKGGKATAAIRVGNSVVLVSQNNCSDELAELLESGGKYAHLVERVNGYTPVVAEKKTEGQVKVTYPDLEVTILTSQTTEEKEVKKRGRKPKSK